MKAKTIKKIISKKLENWIKSIDDPKIQELVQKNSIVTGGCIASMLLNENVNDYDIYFRNLETVLNIQFVQLLGYENFLVVDGL